MPSPQRPTVLGDEIAEALATPTERGGIFVALRHPSYRWYWLGQLGYFAALQMETLAQSWLVYDMTGSPLALGVVNAAWGLPMVLLLFFGGAVADRMDKRRLLIITAVAKGLVIVTIAILISTGAIAFWHLVVAGVLTGISFAFSAPGRQAIISELVSEQELMNAIALNSAATNLMRFVGPAIAGVLVAVIGIAGVYYIAAGLCGLAVAPLFMISVRKRAPSRSTSVGRDLVQGASYIRRNPTILALLAMGLVPVVFAMPYQFLMPVFAVDVLKVGASGLGWLLAMAGVGALVGSLGAASLGSFRRKGWLMLGLTWLFGFALVLFSLSQVFALSLVLLLAVGVGSIGYLTVNNTLLQVRTPPELRGRVLSVYMMSFGLMPLGALPIGAVAEVLGAPQAVGLGGAVVILFTLAMVLLPVVRRLE